MEECNLQIDELADEVTDASNVEHAPDGEVAVLEGKIKWQINTSYIILLGLGHCHFKNQQSGHTFNCGGLCPV